MPISREGSFTRPERKRVVGLVALLIILSLSLTLIQDWVGRATVYAPDLEARRMALHEAILYNRLPPGVHTWRELGANSVNTRVGVVYLAEGLTRLTGQDTSTIYRVIDLVALFASLIALFFYLSRFVPPVYAIIGVVYVGAMLPLTSLFGYFHPWDRVSLLAWISLLFLLRTGRFGLFAALLAVCVTIKFDIFVLPLLYWLVRTTPKNWPAVTAQTVALVVLTFGIWSALLFALPGGTTTTSALSQLQANLTDFRDFSITFPPLIGFAIPATLAVLGLRHEQRFTVASVAVGFLFLMVLLLQANFREFRAELPALVLILPAALGTIERAFAAESLS